uniref:Uncharacterized protein n=1 Tax=Glossina pallidipes TaxID=7398 RepID=A0A1B0AFA3_GLOPL
MIADCRNAMILICTVFFQVGVAIFKYFQQMPFNSKNKEESYGCGAYNSERKAYDFLKKEALDTLTVQLCNMSDTKYKRAIFFEANVEGLPNDSATHSHISSAASACSMQNIIASPILDRSVGTITLTTAFFNIYYKIKQSIELKNMWTHFDKEDVNILGKIKDNIDKCYEI